MTFVSPHRKIIIFIMLLIINVVTVTGCEGTATQTNTPTDKPVNSVITPSSTITKLDTPSESTNPEVEEVTTETPSPTAAEVFQTLPDVTGTAPEDWRQAPIIPEISDRVVEIYQVGQTLGRDPLSFSVIGDCQSIPFVFMGPFSRGELEPDPSESQLWNAINAFDSSFKRWAVTARGGFTAASILNPLQADPESCKPGETPLTCEYRLNNPAFVLITLETWLDPETVERYEIYLRKILDAVIERGSVPILLTKADSSELRGERHVINPVIVKVGYEYDVPVVNFWRAAQYLDNYGIDPEREGFHLSQAGYNLKNILALRTLYAAWVTVADPELAETSPTAAPTPTATPEETEEPQVKVEIPDCNDGCTFFGAAQSRDGEVLPQGVYSYNPTTKTLSQVLGAGFDLQDVSEDGTRLLANQMERLYEINLETGAVELISTSLFSTGHQTAYWDTEDNAVIFLDQDDPIQTESGNAINLLPSNNDGLVFFESGECSAKDFCEITGVYQQIAGEEPRFMEKYSLLVFSPDGTLLAYLNPEAATPENYYHIPYLVLEETEVGAASRRVLYLPDEVGFEVYPEVEAFAFSPQSDQLILLYDAYSEYYEKSLRLQTYLWNLNNGILYNFGKLEGTMGSLNPKLVWAPDGKEVLFFLTDLSEEGEYRINLYKTNLENGEKLMLVDENILAARDYLYLTNLYWR